MQTTTVADFRARFEAIANESVRLPEVMLVECFISGLKMDIQTEVAIRGPTILEEAIRLTHLYEQKFDMARVQFVLLSLGPNLFYLTPLDQLQLLSLSLLLLHHIYQNSLSNDCLQLNSNPGVRKDYVTIVMKNTSPTINAKHFPSYSFLKSPLIQQLSYLSHSHRRISLLKNFSA